MADDRSTPKRPSRLEPMEEGSDALVMTDRQSEDHAQRIRGERSQEFTSGEEPQKD